MEQSVGSRYVLREKLGKGGMGVVYRAERRDGSADRAIKMLRPDVAEDATIRDRFIQECNLMRAMRSPNLVAVEDLIVDGDDIAIVMELVVGGTLRAYLEASGPLPPEIALEVVRQILLGLMKVHSVGIVHRDLKPENVLLVGIPGEKGFLAKVSDFGIARLVNGPRMTGTDVFIGTPHYSAPELIEGSSEPSPAADIYAAGVVLYELLSGLTPFAGVSGYALMTRQLNNPAPRQDVISDPVWSLLEGWLSVDPNLRPRNGTEALEELDALIADGVAPTRARRVSADASGLAASRGLAGAASPMVPAPAGPVGSMPGVAARQAVKRMADVASPDVIDLASHERSGAGAGYSVPPREWFPYDEPPVEPIVYEDATQLRARPVGPPPSAGRPGSPSEPRRRRNVLIAVATVVVVVLAALGALFALSGNASAKVYTLKFAPEDYPQANITVDRIWTLTGGKHPNLHGDLTFKVSEPSATRPTSTLIYEVLPASLADSVDQVKFTPQPGTVSPNSLALVAGFQVEPEPGKPTHASYDVAVKSGDISPNALKTWAGAQSAYAALISNKADPLQTLKISPNPEVVQVGIPGQLHLSGTLANNKPAPTVAFGDASYEVAAKDVASVSKSGLVTGLKAGTTTVTATVIISNTDTVSSRATIKVKPAPKGATANSTQDTDGSPAGSITSGSTKPGKTSTTACQPGEPSNGQATPQGTTGILLHWSPPSSEPSSCSKVTGYTVLETGPLGNVTKNFKASERQWTLSNLSAGPYSFVIEATNGNVPSEAYQVGQVTIKSPPCSLPPSSPQVSVQAQTIQVIWSAPTNTATCSNTTSTLSGYTVTGFGSPRSVGDAQTSFQNVPAGSYSFTVIANYSGAPPSTPVAATPKTVHVDEPQCSVAPQTPSGAVVASAPGGAVVHWSAVPAPPNCQVTYSVASDPSSVALVASTTSPDTSATLPLSVGGLYVFAVTAHDSVGPSTADPTGQFLFSLPCDPASLAAPLDPVATPTPGSSDVQISWANPAVPANCPTPSFQVSVSGTAGILNAQSPATLTIADGQPHTVSVTANYPDVTTKASTSTSFTAEKTCPDNVIVDSLEPCPSPPVAGAVGQQLPSAPTSSGP